MSELEECRAQLETLKERLKECRERLKNANTTREQYVLKSKIKTYQDTIKDIQVQLDYLDPPEQRKARKARRKRLDIGSMPFDFFERSGACWSDLEGHSWEQLEAGDPIELGETMAQLREWMAEGSEQLTDRQRLYLDAYYNNGLSMDHIAQMYGVNKSSVSRVICSGLDRMQSWVDSKKLAHSCVEGRDGFDWKKYLSQVSVLSDRQRQLLLLVLSKCPKSYDELGEKLEINKSTVSRTLHRAGKTIHHLGIGGTPIRRPKFRDWKKADKYSLAIETGMPLYFYYRYCFRGQNIGGVSRYMYELARRREAGKSVDAVAKKMGLKPKTVRSAYDRLKQKGVRVGGIPLPSADCIGAKIDPETYVKLQRMVTSYADS